MEPLLFRAIRSGDIDDVQRQISSGADISGKVWEGHDHGAFLNGITPLMVAAAAPKSSVEIVRMLLDAGADPSEVSDGQVGALWYAAGGGTGYRFTEQEQAEDPDHPYRHWGGGDADRLRLFLDAGLSPNESANNGRTSVGEACRIGDPKRVALLIERGASVWPVRVTHGTPASLHTKKKALAQAGTSSISGEEDQGFQPYAVPLFQAAEEGCAECVRLILEQGFPAGFRCDGENAIDVAESLEVVEILWEAGARSEPSGQMFDALDRAFERGSNRVAAFLLGKIPLEKRSETLQRQLALSSGVHMNPAAIRMLLDFGADPTRPDPNHGSALHYACWQRDGNGERENKTVEEAVRLLIGAGADPNMIVPEMGTPMHEAMYGDGGSPTAVRVLLEHGADPDALDADGATPLILAASRGEVECLRLLLDAGADPKTRSASGGKAIDYARSHLNTWREIVADRGGKRNDYQSDALTDAETVVQLLEAMD